MPVRPTPGPVTTPTTTAPSATTTPATTPTTATPPTTPSTPPPPATFDGTPGHAGPIPSGAVAAGAMSAVALRAAAAGVDPALLAKLKDPAELKKTVEQFATLVVATDGQAITKKQEAQIFQTLGALSAAGQLGPAVAMLADAAEKQGALPPGLPPEKKQGLILQLTGLIEAEVAARGAAGDKSGRFPSWNTLSNRHLKRVRDTQVPPAGPGTKSAFLDPRFVAELQKLTGAKFSAKSSVEPLIDGPASFKARDALIDGAKKSIHMMTWALYDDATGRKTTDKLIAAHKRGVDVKIVVDGNVAKQPGHDKMLAELEAAGIQVVRWADTARPHDGQHRKFMIVDDATAIAGGMNVGDVYSHGGPAGTPKWRDTDVKMTGDGTVDLTRLFAGIWNSQKKSRGLPIDRIRVPRKPPAAVAPPAGTAPQGQVQVINDTPGPRGNANILLAALKAIEGATTRVDIENAYLITTPALQDALIAAAKRGVQVRILTNSAESVDEPIVSAPIQASLPALIDAGCEVYLKKGDTLHSKFMVVDDVFSMVTSYNLHPRSERYEGEVALNILDEGTAKGLADAFKNDIAAATHVAKSADVVVPKSAMSVIASRFFFDQL